MSDGSPFSVSKADRDMKQSTQTRLMLRLRMVELHLQSPLYFHGVVLNKLSTGTTLTLPYIFGGNADIYKTTRRLCSCVCRIPSINDYFPTQHERLILMYLNAVVRVKYKLNF
jgi:hypothetical protein